MGLFSGIRNKYRSFKRYNQILRVFVRYGFKDMVAQMIESSNFRWIRRLIPRTTRKKAELHTKWEKMRFVCEELGPTFVKFGQILSNRPDILPAELVREFEKLQDNVPPVPAKVAKDVLESELKKSVEILFTSFEPEAFASASMAQVHKAQLRTGELVAVKIQRPNIRQVIIEDIRVMYTLAGILERRIPSLKAFDLNGLVSNFEDGILKEMDFIHESINIQRFYVNLEEDKKEIGTSCPKVYQEYTTDKILTMEFVKGTKVSDFDELLARGHDRKEVAKKLAVSYVKQVFEYGFFHADLHPGNILVMHNGTLCFLDFGLMGSIMQRDIEMFGRLFVSVKDKDVRKIIRSLQQMSGDFAVKDMRAFEYAINDFVQSYSATQMHQNEMSSVLNNLKDIILEHGLKVPSHFFLLARSMVTVEGVIHKLDPDLDLLVLARPFMRKIVAKKLNPLKWGEKIFNTLYEFGAHMEDFPRDLKNAVRRINTGQISVNLNHQGIDPVVHTINRVTKQIVAAVIVAGLLVGAVMLIINDIGPKWQGYSAFGVIGVFLALIVVAGMIRDIWKGDFDDWKGWGKRDN
jgi:ubiquinone biosynthesis protein